MKEYEAKNIAYIYCTLNTYYCKHKKMTIKKPKKKKRF